MEENDYKAELRNVLDTLSTDSINKLNCGIQALPEKTESIEMMIFPDQDGEGTFSLRISLTGPDLYVLNNAITDFANIIDVKHTPEGLMPNVPLMDPFDSNFEVNDALCDVVCEWLEAIWKLSETDKLELPVTIVADEGYGTKLPKKLN